MLDKNIKRPYLFKNYDPAWATAFESIKKNLEMVFKEKALSIEHVGSTSIAGMKAKPIIDVLVVVEKIELIDEEKKQMEALGYKWGDNYIEPNSIVFFKEKEDSQKTENIHVCEKDSPKAIQFIQTRDYLRAHPERAIAYGEVKEKLKNQHPDDYPAYRAGKQAFLDETEKLTYEWIEAKE